MTAKVAISVILSLIVGTPVILAQGSPVSQTQDLPPATVVFAASGARQGGPGRISATTTTGRQIQLGLKVTF